MLFYSSLDDKCLSFLEMLPSDFVSQIFPYQALWGHPWLHWGLLYSHVLYCSTFVSTKASDCLRILLNSGNQIDELFVVCISVVSEKHTNGWAIHFKKIKVVDKPIWTKKLLMELRMIISGMSSKMRPANMTQVNISELSASGRAVVSQLWLLFPSQD